MAVEILDLSVVLRRASRRDGTVDRFDCVKTLFAWEPTRILEDPHLAAMAFMCPADMRRFGRSWSPAPDSAATRTGQR